MMEKSNSVVDKIIQEINEHAYSKNNQDEDDLSKCFVLLYKDESKFWNELFRKYFLVNFQQITLEDDLLFFVRKKKAKIFHQGNIKIDTFRRNSKNLPLHDFDIDWEESFYFNIIMQKFVYTLIYCTCTRTASNQIQIIKKSTQTVYPSPASHKMNGKSEYIKMTYPDIYFSIDNFENKLENLPLYDGESICIEIVAKENTCNTAKSIYFGLVEYESIRNLFETKLTSQRHKNSNAKKLSYVEYIKIFGPNSEEKGEIAVKIHSFDEECLNNNEIIFSDLKWNNFSMLKKKTVSEPLTCYLEKIWIERNIRKSKSENQNVDKIGTEYIIVKDLNKELKNESFTKLWNSPGYSQTHFRRKEINKSNSPFYNSYLTFISLPWHQIVNNLLTPKKKPILLF